MLLTTTPGIEGRRVQKYLGIVSGDSTDPVLTHGTGDKPRLDRYREAAIQNLTEQADKLGANAVVGVAIGYTVFNENSCIVAASGTAVVID